MCRQSLLFAVDNSPLGVKEQSSGLARWIDVKLFLNIMEPGAVHITLTTTTMKTMMVFIITIIL